MMVIQGRTTFVFSDEFTDPVDVRQTYERLTKETVDPEGSFYGLTEAGGTAYRITDAWAATFDANILLDASRSLYGS